MTIVLLLLNQTSFLPSDDFTMFSRHGGKDNKLE